ncbi:TolC family protein [Lacinutrix sp. Bg11-31]|uniref:TolC family protein n=1 Tax=Lacinutrix sp. Bg11-31 TaxID=2057808 RepID=UPI000C3112BE|nr:TolC family protein [Lacinutrix sp. Bg11-31]AUC81492.1 transporter [Lacinutrix sp. Bg11-31]
MKHYILIFSFFVSTIALSQTENDMLLTFSEYLGYVKQYHPIAKQANLKLEEGQAYLIKARGGFDPKIEIDYDRKDFKDKEYYNLFNATFKVPTWYGIEAKANFEDNSGVFLNPQNNVPNNGLFTAGISASLGQGLFINERMATLKKAQFYKEQTKAERNLQINDIIYQASIAYFSWLQSFNETEMYQRFLANAKTRYKGVRASVLAGDKAGIDSLEANININNRALALEQSKVGLMKNRLMVSNFLWLDNQTPLEINPSVAPKQLDVNEVDAILKLEQLLNFNVETHPKLKALDSKISGLEVEKRLKANKLLLKADIQYNFITQDPDISNTYSNSNYKAGLNIAFPLFLRKERGDLRLSKLKIEASKFERTNTSLSLSNKVESLQQELESYVYQNEIIEKVVEDYKTLLSAEERKFSFGESSIFLINYRESSLIDAQLKQLKLKNKFYNTKAKLFTSLGIVLN